MKVRYKTEDSDIATVYLAEDKMGRMVEFVESVQPPYPRSRKWVLIVSTLFGCPVDCRFCDAGGGYRGKLSSKQILDQIDYLICSRFPDRSIPVEKFKIQFSRVGEPVFNRNVLQVLKDLPGLYSFRRFIPSISTIAPAAGRAFFDDLLRLRRKVYSQDFQLQFSIHTTDEKQRDHLIPVPKWSLSRIAEYGNEFFNTGGHKISLNFALGDGWERDTVKLRRYFDPAKYLIKVTPVNPTFKASRNGISCLIQNGSDGIDSADCFRRAGYDVILSIGEREENLIGSNCGQYISAARDRGEVLNESYSYRLIDIGKSS